MYLKELQNFIRKYYLIVELLIFKYRWQNISQHQWRRNRGFRQFNEPGPPNSWGPE